MARVLVLGSGAMGSQIALASALAGHDVTLSDVEEAALGRAEAELRQRMSAQVAKGRRTAAEVEDAFGRLRPTTDLDAASTADIVVEAVVEVLDVKREVFARLSQLCSPDALLTSNSSSFVPSAIAEVVTGPERFCNVHFFNPALVMRGVEVVRGPATSDATTAAAVAFVESLGKLPIVLDKEIPGFVANRILNAVRDEALRLLEGGYASVEAIDTACRTALGYPMGPFELMDLTGIDIGYLTKTARYQETGDPADAPAATVARLVAEGHLGRKTGQGFYSYDHDGNKTGVC